MPNVCAITGTVRNISGEPIISKSVVFFRDDVVGQDGDVIVPPRISVTTSVDGNLSFNLYPGFYTGFYTTDRNVVSFKVQVPDAVSGNLSAMITQAPAPIEANEIILARQYRDEALVSETNAATSETNAGTSEDNAADSAAASQVSRLASETASDIAVAAAADVLADRIVTQAASDAAVAAQLLNATFEARMDYKIEAATANPIAIIAGRGDWFLRGTWNDTTPLNSWLENGGWSDSITTI